MAVITTDGLIIKEQKVGESDRLITILTRDNGLIRAFAPHALRMRSKNLSATQLLAYSRLTIFKGRDTYKVNEAQAMELFFDLRSDMDALFLAGYFCELACCLAPQEEAGEDFLRLLLNALFLLSGKRCSPALVKAVVELRFAAMAGYMPDLGSCARCGEDAAQLYFDFAGGTLLCEHCDGARPGTAPLPRGILAAMRHILSADDSRVFGFRLPDAALRQLSLTTERFVSVQTDRDYKTLALYKSIQSE